jgi:hypothetical protein
MTYRSHKTDQARERAIEHFMARGDSLAQATRAAESIYGRSPNAADSQPKVLISLKKSVDTAALAPA